MKTIFAALLAASALIAAPAAPAAAQEKDDYGVLVMAHGGGPEWNAQVQSMLEPLKQDYALELAFGMADPASLDAAVDKLEARGADRIGVVRLFISGESFRERTEQILGLAPGAPPKPESAGEHAHHGGDGGHSMALWRIDSGARFALSDEGLSDAPEMGAVLAERARALSKDPASESILILAHGPADDAEDARWIESISERAEAVRDLGPFRSVEVMTLREDWPEKRAESEQQIRAFVEAAGRDGGTAIVIPYRVAGFGPYAKVLEGLAYVSDGRGLVPSDSVRQWVRRQAEDLQSELAARDAVATTTE